MKVTKGYVRWLGSSGRRNPSSGRLRGKVEARRKKKQGHPETTVHTTEEKEGKKSNVVLRRMGRCLNT